MSQISDSRRELGKVAAEWMQLSTDITDFMVEFTAKAAKLQKKAREEWAKVDSALNGEGYYAGNGYVIPPLEKTDKPVKREPPPCCGE